MTKLPEYVEYGSLATAPSPLRCKGTTLSMFLMHGDLLSLFAICHKVIAKPTRYSVVPLPIGPAVLATFGEIEAIVAEGGDYGKRGKVAERQIATWVPALFLTPRSKPKAFIGMLVVNMWLDNPISVASGREQFGYPKSWGWGTFPEELDRRTKAERPKEREFDFSLEVPALQVHREDETLEPCPLLSMSPVAGPRPEQEFGKWEEVSGALFEQMTATSSADAAPGMAVATGDGLQLALPAEVEGREEILSAVGQLGLEGLGAHGSAVNVPGSLFQIGRDFAPPVNQTFLRQFRAPGDGTRATDQTAVTAPATVTKFHGGHVLGAHKATITKLASHPLERELGLKQSSTAEFAVEARFDFDVDNGRVLS